MTTSTGLATDQLPPTGAAFDFADWRPRFPTATTALLAIALAISAADAGTVSKPNGSTVLFTAAAGEANSIMLSKLGTSIIIGDGMPVTAAPGSGCSQVAGNPNQVSCPLSGVSIVTVLAGDMNDQVMNTFSQANVVFTLDGGLGDDWLEGGPGPDYLMGGNGCDTFDGQGGYDNIRGDNNGMGCFDTVNYADFEPNPSTGAGVTVIVGGTGGTDMVNEDVETIIGSAGHDFIQGDGQDALDADDRDFIFGGAGNDFIFGGAGVDQLVGGTGNDQVYGEGDDDQVSADESFAAGDGTADDYIDCGPGTDVSWGESADGLIFGAAQQFKDCETKHIRGSLCGNGMLDAGETCDDANVQNGDCCSQTCQYEPSGSACNDGNACTLTDTCNATGTCVGSNPLTCTAQDECHVAGACNPATGSCSNPTKPDGAVCTDDANVCTSDTCQAGVCSHPPVANGTSCPDDGNVCTTDTCGGAACTHPPVANGTTCADDGNSCTTDSCQSGACSHPPLADGASCADDGDSCTSDSCQAGSCAHPPVANGANCPDDGNACTGDACQDGVCAHPPVADNTPCPEDGNPCTIDACAAGVCGGTCRENAPCSAGVDTICRQGAGGCACEVAPPPPDPSVTAPPVDQSFATDVSAATAFLYSGSTPVQSGVAPGTIDRQRAALLRGLVQQQDGSPLASVRVSILGHPEFGWTYTRSDGRFDMVVNGGGLLTVRFARAGYLGADRQIDVDWQDYVTAATVVLLLRDAEVTTVDLTAAAPIQIHRGSVISDASGSRRATLFFTQGTQATLVQSDGTTQPISLLNVRATEYTVGSNGFASMPAELPPASAYTYAVELDTDEAVTAGAPTVQFDRPVIHYVENFLNFPAGIDVPTGYYDRQRGLWVASDSGRVLAIVSISGGLANLDITGDGVADSASALAALGITDAERQQLATLYAAGQKLWRVPISHFSSWDCNFGFGPPPDAGPPNPPCPKGWACGGNGFGGGGNGGGGFGGGPPPGGGPNPECGSIIECENQALGESLPLTGTPFTLNYKSDRVPGRTIANTLTIPLSGATVPASLKRIELEVTVAGRTTTQTFAAAPNQTTTFTWDGQDAYGRRLQGSQQATVRIGFVYDGTYERVSRFGYNGNGAEITGSTTRREVALWIGYTDAVGPFDARGVGLGGWTLSAHHAYDSASRTLYRGDGTRRGLVGTPLSVLAAAGNGTQGFSGDGGPATAAQFRTISGVNALISVAAGPDGSMYITDPGNHRVRRVGRDGIIQTIAGNGSNQVTGNLGDGGPALQAAVATPTSIVVGRDGSVYVGQLGANRIRRIAPDGIITTVAGGVGSGFSGDGGPATAAQMGTPIALALHPDGSLYFVDGGNSRIRRVGPDGIITTVAGQGSSGSNGDGQQATLTRIFPSGVAIHPDGFLYVSESPFSDVRRVGSDGIMRRVAGIGGSGAYSGDGGPATAAQFNNIQGIAFAPNGTLYIADVGNRRVRRVTPDGIITTVAGSGVSGDSGDGGPAPAAQFTVAHSLAVSAAGNLLVADTNRLRVRRLAPPFPGVSATDFFFSNDDASEIYVFDFRGRHLRTLHGLTAAVRQQFAYDSSGRLSSITDESGNTTAVERTAGGVPTAIVAPGGQRTAFGVDPNGFLSSLANPANETTQVSSTVDGLLRFLTTPRQHVYEFTYGPGGLLSRDDDPAGGSKALTRTENGNAYAVAVTTGLGRVTGYSVESLSTGATRRTVSQPTGFDMVTDLGIDGTNTTTAPDGTVTVRTGGADPRFGMQAPLGTLLRTTTPGGRVLTRTESRSVALADPLNLLSLTAALTTRVTNGRASTDTYAAGPRTITTQTAAGRQRVTSVDNLGRVASAQLVPLAAKTTTYDGNGRVATVTQGTGPTARTYTFGYDPMNRLATITDPATRTTGIQYDDADRVIVQTLPDGRQIQFGYDASGNVTSVTPPGRPAHTFGFTPVDLEQRYTPPVVPNTGSNLTTYAYNVDRQLDLITRPDGQTVDFVYDAAGRLETIITPTGATTYNYDAMTGNLASVAAPGGSTINFGFDGALPTSVTWAGPVAGSVTHTYDNDFRVSTISVNGGHSTALEYDADSLLTQVGDLVLTRDPQTGLVTGTTLGQVSDSRAYNAFGEIATYTVTTGGVEKLKIEYLQRDALGRLAEKRETVGGQVTTYGYTYDLAGRLETVTINGTTLASYAYDNNGNRLAAPNLTGPPTYDDQDRLLAYGNATYDYTANGDLAMKSVAGQTTTYAYDELGNLRQVDLSSSTVIEYVIDGRNRRVGKRVNGALTKGWLYSDQLRPVAELDGGGNITARFVYGSAGITPDYIVKGATTYRLIADHLGSPRLVIDVATGTVAQRIDYDEFGRVTMDTSPGFQPFGFGGGLRDADIQLLHFGARDYDAHVGRWTAKDPIGFAGGDWNLYGYVLNDPINLIDPLGLYGTQSCDYYRQACDANGGWYECHAATICETFLSDNVSNCIRQCLQNAHYWRMPEPDACSADNNIDKTGNVFDHAGCIGGCLLNPENPFNPSGPDLPDADPMLF